MYAYVVIPTDNGTVDPVPNVSVKIGSPELPTQKPNCAFSLKTEIPNKTKSNNAFLFLIILNLIDF